MKDDISNADIVIKVADSMIGPVEPIGETNADDQRYEKMKDLITVTDHLIEKLFEAAPYAHRVEYSMKRAGDKAIEALRDFDAAIQDFTANPSVQEELMVLRWFVRQEGFDDDAKAELWEEWKKQALDECR